MSALAGLQQLSLTDKVTLGTALLGAMAGVVGTFAVLRRRALVGDMLAHAALPGVCLAFLWTGSRDLTSLSLGALASGLVAIGLMTLLVRGTRTREDAALGIVLSTFFGLGVVLLSGIARSPAGGSSAGLQAYLFGEPGNMMARDLELLAAVGLGVLVLYLALFKEFKAVSFDPAFAHSQGWPTLAIDLGLMASVAIVTIVGLPIVGVILMAALLILPAAAARLWTNQLWIMTLLAAGIGAAAGVLGTRVGSHLPAGPAIVLAAAGLFCLSVLFAPRGGIAARLLAGLRLRLRIGREHLLRSLYELNESELPQVRPVAMPRLLASRYWSPWLLRCLLWQVERRGLCYHAEQGVVMTEAGLHQAAEAVKTHRLWELYMIGYAGSATDHVDRSADDVEHLLPAELRAELEVVLARQGRLPSEIVEVPPSPHHLESTSN